MLPVFNPFKGDKSSLNPAQSLIVCNFIGGFEFFETDVLFEPEEIVLITQEMQLYVYSINYAFAILDFRGWDDDPYWVNFGLFGIPDED